MLIGERTRTTIDAPGGFHWDSGWRFLGGIKNRTAMADSLGRWTPMGQGSYWLHLAVDSSFYDAAKLKDAAVRVHSRAAFTMLSAPHRVHLPVPCPPRLVAPGEFCSVTIRNGRVAFSRFSGSGRGAPYIVYRVKGQFRTRDVKGIRTFNGSEEFAPNSELGPLSAWFLASSTISTPEFVPTEVEVETRREAGFFERDLSMDSIRLEPYEVGRTSTRGAGFAGRNQW